MGVWKILTIQGVLMLPLVVLGKPDDGISAQPTLEPVCDSNIPEESSVSLHSSCSYTSSCKRSNALSECIAVRPGYCVCDILGAAEERKGKKIKAAPEDIAASKSKKKKTKTTVPTKSMPKKTVDKKTMAKKTVPKNTKIKKSGSKKSKNKKKNKNKKKKKKKIVITVPPPTTTTRDPNVCLPGWDEWKHRCYKVLRLPENYYILSSRCKELHEEATLMSIHSQEENDFFVDNYASRVDTMFIGMVKDWIEYRRFWADRTHMTYTNWGKYLGTEGCAITTVQEDYKWTTWRCSELEFGVCKYYLPLGWVDVLNQDAPIADSPFN